jgi:hypothetical protein
MRVCVCVRVCACVGVCGCLQLTLTDGAYTLWVQSTDAYGLVEASPLLKTFIVDSTPPVVTAVIESASPSRDTFMRVRLSCAGARLHDRGSVCRKLSL